MDIVLKALVTGLGISIMVGPIFFGLIQLSVERGTRAGVIYASGIWISDLLFVLVVQKGLGYIGNDPNFILGFGLIGSVILIAFGVGIYASPMKRGKNIEISMKNAVQYFFKGVTINIFNPFVILLWVSVLSAINADSIHDQWLFVGVMFFVVATVDVLKVLFASKIISKLDDSKLVLIKNSSGIILGGFGVVLLIRTFLKLI